MNNPTATKPRRRVRYGIKAYGTETLFDNKIAFRNYLLAWIAGTDGAEKARAQDALDNLAAGIPYTDTDAPADEPLPFEWPENVELWMVFHRCGMH